MTIRNWSLVAASNNSAPPNGWPEGMAPSGVNNAARQMMSDIRDTIEQLPFFDYGHTPTRIDNDTITVATDLTATYYTGRRIKLVGATTGYGSIASSSYSAPDTTVNVTMDSGNVPTSLVTVSLGLDTTGNAIEPFYRITPAETAAGVTPVNFYVKSRRVERVIRNATPGTTVMTDDIEQTINACPEGSVIIFDTDRTGLFLIDRPIVQTSQNIEIKGNGAVLFAKAATQFEYMYLATSKTGIHIADLVFDANHANRSSSQSVRFMGAGFSASTDCSFNRVTAKNCLGYDGVSAVGLVAAGASTRCVIDRCTLLDCGTAGLSPAKDADGVFTSGEQNTISDCVANNCTDTGFVIESSNQSIISGGTTRLCGAGAAITSANASDKGGNVIDGLTINNWKGSVGAIQVGIPGSYAGNLLDSKVSDVTIVADTPTYGTPGPAILVSGTAAFGEVRGLTIADITIRGSTTQGILVQRGLNVHVKDPDISGTTDACIQFQNGTGHQVVGGFLSGGSYGVLTQNASEAFVQATVMRSQTTNGLFAADTSTLYMHKPVITGATGASAAKDSGATLAYGDVAITYSASMTPNAELGESFTITATNTTAFTLNAPTKGIPGQVITLMLKNSSGGAMGVITWNGAYYMSAWTNPADGFSRSISFRFNGSVWVQVNQTGVDVPN